MKRNGDGGCVWEREVFGIVVQGRRGVQVRNRLDLLIDWERGLVMWLLNVMMGPANLLSRHPHPKEEFTQYLATSDPTLNPIQYLARESARNANTPLFRYLLDEYPSLLSTSTTIPATSKESS